MRWLAPEGGGGCGGLLRRDASRQRGGGVQTRGSHHVCAQVNAQDGDGSQRQWNVDDDEEQEGGDLWDVTGQSVGDGLLQVIEDQTA